MEKYLADLEEILVSQIFWYVCVIIFLGILLVIYSFVPKLKKVRKYILIAVCCVILWSVYKGALIRSDMNEESIVILEDVEFVLKERYNNRHTNYYMFINSTEKEKNLKLNIAVGMAIEMPEKGRGTVVYGKHSKYILSIDGYTQDGTKINYHTNSSS